MLSLRSGFVVASFLVISVLISGRTDAQTAADRSFQTRRLIPVRVVDFFDPNGAQLPTRAAFTQANAQRAIEKLNITYRSLGVQFYLRSFHSLQSPVFAFHSGAVSYTWPSPASSADPLAFNRACTPTLPDGGSIAGRSFPQGVALAISALRCSSTDEMVLYLDSGGGGYGEEPWYSKLLRIDRNWVAQHDGIGWSVFDYRMLAHEVGHTFGLQHPKEDISRTVYPTRGVLAGTPASRSDFWDLYYDRSTGSVPSSREQALLLEGSLDRIQTSNDQGCAPYYCTLNAPGCAGLTASSLVVPFGCGDAGLGSEFDARAAGMAQPAVPGFRAKANIMTHTGLEGDSRRLGDRDEHFFSQSQRRYLREALRTEIALAPHPDGRPFYSGVGGRTTLGEGNWTDWKLVATGVLAGPGLASDGYTVYVAFTNSARSVQLKVLRQDLTWWPSDSSSSDLGGDVKGTPELAWTANGIDLVVVGQADSVFYKRWSGVWDSAFTALGGTVQLPLSVYEHAGDLNVVARGLSGVWNKVRRADASWWPSTAGWSQLSPSNGSSAVSSGQSFSSSVLIARRSATGGLEVARFNGAWGPWLGMSLPTGTSLDGAPIVCKRSDLIVVRLSDGSVRYAAHRMSPVVWTSLGAGAPHGADLQLLDCEVTTGESSLVVARLRDSNFLVLKTIGGPVPLSSVGTQLPSQAAGWTEFEGVGVVEARALQTINRGVDVFVRTNQGELWHRRACTSVLGCD